VQEKTYREIAANLNVDQSTVCRTVALFDETGGVSPKEYPSNLGPAKLTEIEKLLILELVLEKPGIYLHEITADVKCTLGLDITESAVCKFLRLDLHGNNWPPMLCNEMRTFVNSLLLMYPLLHRIHSSS